LKDFKGISLFFSLLLLSIYVLTSVEYRTNELNLVRI